MRINIGELYWCKLERERGSDKIWKERPVLVVKCDWNSNFVHVVPLTSNLSKPQNDRHVLLVGFGLTRPIIALIEQVRPVDKASLGKWIGSLRGTEELEQILTLLARFFKPDAA